MSDNHLLDILKALSTARVEFIVAGGVAIVLQGVERATMDLDISLNLSAENVAKFLDVIKDLGMVPRVPVPGSVLSNPDLVQRMIQEKGAVAFTFIHPDLPFKQIDVFLPKHLRYEALIGGSEVKNLAGGVAIKVTTKEKLIEMKKMVSPRRDKDDFDIQALSKLLGQRT